MTDFVPYLGDVLSGVATADAAERRQTWDGLLQVGAQRGWDQARPGLKTRLTGPLGAGEGLPNGVVLYDIEVHLAETISLARGVGASSAAGRVPLQLRLGPNLIKATSTTPTVAGEWADPEFSVDFGIAIDFSLVVDPGRMNISVGIDAAHITGPDLIGAPHLDSQNFSADIVKFFAEVVSPFFGGRNFVAVVEQLIAQYDFASVLNAALKPVNDLLGELAKQGMGAVTALFPDAPAPSGLSTKALSLAPPQGPEPLLVVAQPVVGEGVVRGEIRWPRSAGAPIMDPPFGDAFVLTATVDRGAGINGFVQATDVTHVGSFEDASTESDHVVRYALVGLPLDEPIDVSCGPRAGVRWSGDSGAKTLMVERDGWSGRVTVRPRAIGQLGKNLKIFGKNKLAGQPVDEHPEEVGLNPQPIPPGSEIPGNRELRGSRPSGTMISAAVARSQAISDEPQFRKVPFLRDRENPSDEGVVDGIDFVVGLTNIR